MQIFNSLIPIFAVIALGMLLRWRNFISAETTQGFNRFAYFYALPIFLFYKIAGMPKGTGTANDFLITLLSASVITAITAWLVTRFMGIGPKERGAMIQASFRGNLAFMGLPLIFFTLYDLPTDQRVHIESAILLAIAPVVIFYNVVSVVALVTYNEQTEAAVSWKSIFKNILINPLLIGCVGGLFFYLMNWPLPVAVGRTCEVLGSSAFPLALLGIGSQLATISVSGSWLNSTITSVIKCLICPLVGWGIGSSLGLAGIELQAILIMCAMPTAVSSFVLADQMGGDSSLAASAVVISTAASIVTLPVLLLLTG